MKENVKNSTEWMRLPKRGEKIYGLSRTALNELCLAGSIETRVIKRKNAQRGIRLFRTKSLLDFIENGGDQLINFPE